MAAYDCWYGRKTGVGIAHMQFAFVADQAGASNTTASRTWRQAATTSTMMSEKFAESLSR